MKKQKVLVTGGAGYIGSHILLKLEKDQHEVIVVDNLSTGKKESVHYGKLIVEDIANLSFMDELMAKENFDAIFILLEV